MIKYASELFDINFGKNAVEWNKIYKVRYAAAHNGGIATPQFLQNISGTPLTLNPQEYENIGLTWDELRTAMKYADEIAALIDFKVSDYNLRVLETEQILRELREKRALPDRLNYGNYFMIIMAFFPSRKQKKICLLPSSTVNFLRDNNFILPFK